ncbi:thioredoxin-disulfide reductase [Candidatus Uhrbacteria bacterium]|nr:thioredoxin-disulfide reductase [Candidatus Uhrbacteria bacterium]
MSDPRNVIIIGGGPAGLTAAIYASRAQLQPLVIAGTIPGGQLMLTSHVENFPGFDEPILGPELMERWRKQAMRYGAEFLDEDATAISATERPFTVTAAGTPYAARAIIVATGASAKWLGLPNEQKFMGKGVHTCAQCDGFAYKNKEVVVVGGGDTAMEETLTLAKIASHITILHRRGEFRASKIMADRVLQHPNIRVLWNTVVEDVLGDTRVTGVRARNTETHESIELTTSALFVAIGYAPNTGFLRDQLALRPNGYLEVQQHTRTSVEGIFAAGDVEDAHYRQAVTAAAGGCMAAIDAERWLATQEN